MPPMLPSQPSGTSVTFPTDLDFRLVPRAVPRTGLRLPRAGAEIRRMEARRERSEEAHRFTARDFACIECRRPWLVASERWRLLMTDDDPPEAVAYCPECGRREFG